MQVNKYLYNIEPCAENIGFEEFMFLKFQITLPFSAGSSVRDPAFLVLSR
jgi:hypothetical protein